MEINKITRKNIDHDSVPIENIDGVLKYICSDINRSLLLTKKLKIELLQLFGKQNTTVRKEFLNYVWLVEFNNEIFQISTSNRGTQFYCENPNTKICIDFLKKMEEILTSNKKV